jgi:UDP-GlcNAc3NAcA epimerase
MKIFHIVGARPQFVKMAMICRAWQGQGQQVILHTGQHYDIAMSQQFFDDLQLPQPDINLEVGSGSHAEQTAAMLVGIEKELEKRRPDCVIVYGDTNTTLAGTLMAAKDNIPIAHVEAGLRSFNRSMPEEINRVVTDHLANILFCPTLQAFTNLKNEGIVEEVYLVGDVMADALYYFLDIARQKSKIIQNLRLSQNGFALLTLHRAGNVDDIEKLKSVVHALGEIKKKIVFPVHPRTKKMLDQHMVKLPSNVQVIQPVGYLDMLILQSNAECILTDSGGVQKEGYLMGIRCITLRDETEWVETVQSGWNFLVGVNSNTIVERFNNFKPPHEHPQLYGDGHASEKIVQVIRQFNRM